MDKRLLDVVVATALSDEPTYETVLAQTQDVGEWTADEAAARLAQAILEGVVHATFTGDGDFLITITDEQRTFVEARWS